MIRHRNYYEMAAVVDKMEQRFVFPGDVLLLYLPLAHNYGRLIHLQAVYVGYTLAFCRDPLRVGEGLTEVRPTVFPSVPRVYEKIHTAVVARLDEATAGRSARSDSGRSTSAAEVSRRRQAGEPIPRSLALRHRIADRLVYSKVKKRLGGRLRARELGRRAALAGGDGVLRRPRPADLRGLRADRVHDRLLGQPARRVQVRHGRQAAAGRRGQARRGRRAPDAQPDRLRRLPEGRGGDPRGARRGRLAAHRRHRRDRRGRLHHDHRPQEGHHRHRRRQERRAAEPRERPEGLAVRLAGARPRRPAALRRRADHARPSWSSRSGGPRAART